MRCPHPVDFDLVLRHRPPKKGCVVRERPCHPVVPRTNVRPGLLGGFGVLAGLVGLLAASSGGAAARVAAAAQSSGGSQLPLAARGPVAAAVASHDRRYRLSSSASVLTAHDPAQGWRLRFSP